MISKILLPLFVVPEFAPRMFFIYMMLFFVVKNHEKFDVNSLLMILILDTGSILAIKIKK